MKTWEKMVSTLQGHIRENISLYALMLVALLIGVIAGALYSRFLPLPQQAEFDFYFRLFKENFTQTQGEVTTQSLFMNSFEFNMWLLGGVFLCGLLVVTSPLILVLIASKGFAIGFTVGVLAKTSGIGGVLFAAMSLLPQNLFILPALLIAGVASSSWAIVVIQNRFLGHRARLNPLLINCTMTACIAILLIIFACGLEALIVPVFIGLLAPLLL